MVRKHPLRTAITRRQTDSCRVIFDRANETTLRSIYYVITEAVPEVEFASAVAGIEDRCG